MNIERKKLGLMVAALLSVIVLPTSLALAKDSDRGDRRPAATERRDTGRDYNDRDRGHDNDRGRRDYDNHGGVVVRFGYDRPVYPVYVAPTVVSTGHYETRTEDVLVEPAHYETRTTQVCVQEGYWDTREVPAVEDVYRDRYGDVRRVVTPAHVERVWVPAAYETRTERVWVPATYETRTVNVWVPGYYVDQGPVRGGISIGGVFRW